MLHPCAYCSGCTRSPATKTENGTRRLAATVRCDKSRPSKTRAPREPRACVCNKGKKSLPDSLWLEVCVWMEPAGRAEQTTGVQTC